jgi:PAS domain S-box-containing protein
MTVRPDLDIPDPNGNADGAATPAFVDSGGQAQVLACSIDFTPATTDELRRQLERLRSENVDLNERNQALQSAYQHLQGVNRQLYEFTAAVRQGATKPARPGASTMPPAAAPRQDSQQEQDALFTSLTEVVPVGIFRTDASGNALYASQALCEILGMPLEKIAGFGWIDAVHPQDQPRVRERSRYCIATGRATAMEFRVMRPDGEIRYIIGRAIGVRGPDGQIGGFTGCLEDISEFKRAEKEGRVKDELNRHILDSSTDCLCILDLEGALLNMTSQACKAMEIDDFELLRNSDWVAWWSQQHRETAAAAIARASADGIARFRAMGRSFKGREKWWDVVVSPIHDENGLVSLLLVVSRDITDLHAQQEQIRQINAGLEQRVEQRTRELGHANELLSVALQQARDIYDHAPCGYHSLAGDGLIVEINQTELKWLGYTREEVVGKLHFQSLLGETDRKNFFGQLPKLRAGGNSRDVEFEIRRKDGSCFHALLNAVPELDEQGQFLRTRTSMVDITARKEAEEALQTSRQFLHSVADNTLDRIAYWDSDLRLRFANHVFCMRYGKSMDELMGVHQPDLLGEQQFEVLLPHIKAVLQGDTRVFEASYVDTSGELRHGLTSFLPDLRQGRVVGFFVRVTDITERRRIEDQLRMANEDLEGRIRQRGAELYDSEERFRLMVDGVRDYCIYFMDVDGRISNWTISVQRLKGYTREEAQGRHFSSFAKEQDLSPQSADHLLRIARARGQSEWRGWRQRKDGTRLWAHTIITALRDQRGELRGFSHIMHDMTEIKRAEDLQLNLKAELEQRVRDRTLELEVANQDLESFSYSVSHDLRSPLRHIAGYIGLLRNHFPPEAIDETAEKYLATITSAAQTMSQLIDGLLAFSRLGRASVQTGVVGFQSLVASLHNMMQNTAGERQIEWTIADLPAVLGDAVLLREVWLNLLDNAVKYTRLAPQAHIEVGWRDDGGDSQTFFVRDNGVGFDTKYASKLFGVFQRLHNAKNFEGTGIGLALARRIVERHGGRMWAESQPGLGSTFFFSLPRHPSPGGTTSPFSSP